jgi:peptidoglycan/LPS O-acetylase OafA/YrhL
LVIAVHSSQYFDDLPIGVRALADQGARGVQLFFVASAMTLCMSWHSRNDGALPFYIRRFFRIAPMYYLSIPLFLWDRGFGPSILRTRWNWLATHCYGCDIHTWPDAGYHHECGSWFVVYRR